MTQAGYSDAERERRDTLYCMLYMQVVLRESSSDESSDTETKNAAAAAAAATTVSNDKRPRVTVNSCKNGQAFEGDFAVQ